VNAVFQLDFSGDPTPCDYPGCVLESFHDGDHELAAAPNPAMGKGWEDVRKCAVCGTRFVVYSVVFKDVRTCSSGCMLILAMREAAKLDVSCSCPQRTYPHELRVHRELRSESYNPKFKFRWPWSLMLSQREEPSTERIFQ
jgi:hypothetical protein